MPTDPRLQKLLDKMRDSAQPLSTDTSVPNTSIGAAPRPTPPAVGSIPENAGMPDRPYEGQTPHPRLGVSLKGLSGADKSLTDLAVNREAAKDFPSSKVVNGEILPPKMHHGLGDRLKSIGKGIVLGMGDVARNHPDASTGELLGAGAAGGVSGGASPVGIDAQVRRAQVGQHEGDVARELELAGQSAQVAGAQARPQIEMERVRLEDERQRQQAADKLREMSETERYHHETVEERRNRVGGTKKPDRRTVGNKVVEIGDDGQTRVLYEGDEKPAADSVQLASWYEKKQNEAGSKAAGLRQQADALKDKVNTDYAAGEERTRLLKEAADADKQAAEYRDKRDIEAVKPQRGATSKPDTRKGTISKAQQGLWLKDNQGKTLDDMKKLYPNAVMVK